MLASIIAGAVEGLGKTIFSGLDSLITSDDEEQKNSIEKLKLELAPALAQCQINLQEATHKNIFVSGWRPSIGWCCSMGLAYDFVVRPIANGFGFHFVEIDSQALYPLIIALLGLGGLRTYEKKQRITK
ncbi:MAG: hypothetical protein JKY48_01410 [Flavobacteriales bacterium]|nr:hypothetical protein [Flavobacteriales bacterium]